MKMKITDLDTNTTSFFGYRLILLNNNYTFNQLIKQLIKIRKKDGNKFLKSLYNLSFKLRLPEKYILDCMDKKFEYRDIDAEYNLYPVYVDHPITEEGLYIKIKLENDDKYYERLIRQAKSVLIYLKATTDEQNEYFNKGNKSTIHYLDEKKIKGARKQHGFNVQKDINTYIACEKAIKDMYTTNVYDEHNKEKTRELLDKGASEKLIKYAIEMAADEKLKKISTYKATRIYYEVTRRYHLPTIKDLPRLNSLITS